MIAGDVEAFIRRLIREEMRAVLGEFAIGEKPRHVTIAEYAAARSLSEAAVRAAVRTGRLASIRAGRAVRVPADVEIAPVKKPAAQATERAERRLGIVHGGRR